MRAWKCLVSLMAFSSPATAYAIEAPKCPLPSEALRSYSLSALPEAIRANFLGHIREPIAAPGEDFNPTDVRTSHSPPNRRLIEVDHLKNRWLILYEFGGIVHNTHIVAYRLPGSENDAELFANIQEGFDDKLCRDSVKVLTEADQFTWPVQPFW